MHRIATVAASALLVLGLLAAGSSRAATITDLGTFATPGSGPGQLLGPNGIAAADDGTIYVADTYNFRVQRFTPEGVSLGSFGTQGSGAGQFLFPYGIDVNSAGEVFVSDLSRHDVQVFSATGTFLRTFGAGTFNQPFGLWVSDSGFVYVTDRPAARVRKFTTAGASLGSFGTAPGGNSLVYPQNVEGDANGTLYVSDGSGGARVRTFTADGTFIDSFGGWMNNPTGGALAGGRMYLTEYAVGRLEVIDLSTRTLQRVLGDNEPYTFNSPFDAATVGDSLLYVLEAGASVVHRFRLDNAANAPVAHLIAPNGGESFPSGTTVPVSWSVTGGVGALSVTLQLTRDGGLHYVTVATGLPASGSFDWLATGPGSTHCRFVVRATDTDDETVEDASDGEFTVSTVAPTVQLLSPNGGQSFTLGDQVPVNWIATDDIGVTSVTLSLSLDGGSTYTPITPSMPNSGAYLWPSLGAASSQCRIRVQAADADSGIGEDVSDAVFALVQGPPSPPLITQLEGTIGSSGSGNGQFGGPDGIAVSLDGFLWVADTYNSRVQKLTLNGQHILTVGGPGSGPGKFSRPYGISVDSSGFVYVGDLDRATVQKFDSNGNYLATIGAGIITQPYGLWVGDGVLYVCDRPARRIRRFTTTGVQLADFGPTVAGILLERPQNIEGDGQGRLYISDGLRRIRVLTKDGGWLTQFGSPWLSDPTGAAFIAGHFLISEYTRNRVSDVDVPTRAQSDILGDDEPYVLNVPMDVATSGDSLVFILDTGNNRIVRLRTGSGLPPPAPYVIVPGPSFGGSGTQAGQFGGPDGIATSDDGFVYVADTYNSRVQKFTRTGTHVASFGVAGDQPGQFQRPYGIDVDSQGNVYVSDFLTRFVQKFSSTGQYLGRMGASVSLLEPLGLWVSDAGVLYVTDRGAHVVRLFRTDTGELITTWGLGVGGLTMPSPQNIEGDGLGLFYISDGDGLFRVHEVDGLGHPVVTFGSPWIGNPTGAALAGSHLFLTEYNLNRFSIIDLLSHTRSAVWTGPGTAPGFNSPLDAATSGDSLLFILDTGNNRVSTFHLPALTPPQVTVLAPDGGETLLIGNVATLHWNATDNEEVAAVDLLLTRDGGLHYEALATGVSNSGQYSWTVTEPGSALCRLRVIARDSQGGVGSDLSDTVFEISGGATPTMLLQFSAEQRADGVAVRWQLADAVLQSNSWLERADAAAGDYARVEVERTDDSEGALGIDHSATGTHAYWYRIQSWSAGEQWSFGPVATAPREVIAEFALSAPRPNPAANRAMVSFALPRAADVRLSLIDIQGRELAVPVHERRAAGRHDVPLELKDGGVPAAPGLYFIRLQIAGRPALTRRLIVQR